MNSQLAALHTAAGMCQLPLASHLLLRGADRANLLHNLCSNDIKGLTAGSGCEAFICNPQGKILAHILVSASEESLRILALGTAGTADASGDFELAEYIDRFIFREDVEIEDARSHNAYCVAGARAAEVLKQVGANVPAQPYGIEDTAVAGVAVHMMAAPFIAPACYCVIAGAEHAPALEAALQTAGAVSCSGQAFEAARIAAGFPVYGVDITQTNLPQEVCRDQQAISFTTGCYIGQETVARIDALGHVNWNLAGLQMSGDKLPAAGDALTLEGKDVGRITSAALHPELNRIVALGYVRRLNNQAGACFHTPAGEAFIAALPMV